ncbi:helix-turn-helix domain-containing protein [Streptomyces montanisoli]|uniref:Helix-turn-helix transcriptional regulator n=1 Tax=Streptomyces montanisoli TaxID=2798581 RepID=A0A940MBI9_9ACTN|nr:AraC family transcriptional regulator [Streptomyces montanisoli]MBP0456627.1 helix-turn-helix transcriptional regulator [Streptomyces montanisoli]
MAGPRRDTRGIVDAGGLFARVRFRRREPAPELRPFLEHYWLIDWDLDEPYASQVVPHPSVNVVFQHFARESPGTHKSRPFAEIAGIRHELFVQKLAGRGRVCGVQFRPGGFRPFSPGRSVADWTGRQIPLAEAMPVTDDDIAAVLGPEAEDDRVAALDAYLLAVVAAAPAPEHAPHVARATALADLVRRDRSMRRVDALAQAGGLSPRSLQRLFAGYVGVGPKWVILRYRIHEALERAEAAGGTADWSTLAADLGYSDQAHLVRDFTATVGVSPTAYGRAV